MRKKKILALLLTSLVLLANRLVAFASDISVTDSTTGYTSTKFVATEDMLCNDVVVTIPAEMVLNYNTSSKTLSSSDIVIAQGSIKAGKHLEVSVPTNISYQNTASSSIVVRGALKFGSNGKEVWTPTQVSATSGDSRQITSTVNAYDLEYAGTYKATITYNISIVND